MKKSFVLIISLFLFISCVAFVCAVNAVKGYPGTAGVQVQLSERSYQFAEGWNLIQGVLSPEWIESNSDNIKAIYAYNPISQEYARFYPKHEEDKIANLNFAWETWGRYGAVWVYTDKAFSSNYWTFEYGPLDQIPLFSGWNFIAIGSEMEDRTLGEFKGDCDIQKVVYWDKDNQKWEVWNSDSFLEKMPAGADLGWDDLMFFDQYQIGEGALFKVSSDCKLSTGGNSINSPPEMPN